MRALRICFTLCVALVLSMAPLVLAQNNPSPAQSLPKAATEERGGQNDFDFQIGTWKTHVRRLLHPLTGSTTWAEYDGNTVVRKVWNGKNILVRNIWSDITPNSCRFEQAFS